MDPLHDGRRLPTDEVPGENEPFVLYQRKCDTLHTDVVMVWDFARKRLGRVPVAVIVNKYQYTDDEKIPFNLRLIRKKSFQKGHFGII